MKLDPGVSPPERATLHAAVGVALEVLHAGRLADVYERLAYHFAQAGDTARAVTYLVHLGDQAAERYVPERAIEIWRAALERVDLLPEAQRDHRHLEIIFRLAHNLYLLKRVPESLVLLRAESERVVALDDPRVSGPYYFWLGYALGMTGEVDQVAPHARRAQMAAEASGDQGTLGTALFLHGLERYWKGRPHEGVEALRAAVKVLEATAERWWLGQSQWVLGVCLYHLGEFDDSLAACEHLESIARAFDDRRLQACSLWSVCLVHAWRGDYVRAIELGERGLALSTDPFDRAFSLGYLGASHCEQGNATEAIRCLEESVQVFTASGAFRQHVAYFGSVLGEAYVLAGRLDDAERMVAQAREAAEASAHGVGRGLGWRALGVVAAARGRLEHAETCLTSAVEILGEIVARFLEAQTQLMLARVIAERGDGHRASAAAAVAHRSFAAMRIGRYAELARALADAHDADVVEPAAG